jgi:hypothetical protein
VITINRHKHIAALALNYHASTIIDIVDQIDVVPVLAEMMTPLNTPKLKLHDPAYDYWLPL